MTTTYARTALSLVLTLAVIPASLRASLPDKAVDDVRVFAVYEPVFSQQDVDLLTRVHPDFVCRGWFKWHNTPDWKAYAPLAQACREKGILLQGGITCAALYPGENGMDDVAFRDFACHGTDGAPYLCRQSDFGGWYHLSLYNPKVVDYLKRQVRLEIDAGAVGIWYDEIEGYYDWNPAEGYDPYACAAFRDWLIRKYCVGQGWREDDPRWQTRFNIDLSTCGGTIRTFDYLRHLQTTLGKDGKPLAANPSQGHPRTWATSPNPLFREWGFAWDRKAKGTFRFDTVAAIFADLLADADSYARETYGRTLINTYNHNGTARPGIAFLQPHNGTQPPLRHNRLDGRASYLSYYENLIADAAEVCPEQPVVFFVDWPGETDRLTAMTRADQTHFFSTYIPEAYAAGGEFALPLRGYSYVAEQQGTLATLARMADFYREHAPWLRNSRPFPKQPEAPNRLTLRVRSSACGTVIHLVNHAFSTRDVWPQPRTNLVLTLDWPSPSPSTAFAVSPDFPEQRPVPLTLKNSRLTLNVGTVRCSALVILPTEKALRRVSGTAADGTHILDPKSRALAVAQDGRFTLWLPPEGRDEPTDRPHVLECLESGERLPAHDGASFAAPPAGGFAAGLLLDAFGIPVRHAEIHSGIQRWHTDAWGRFRIPRAQVKDGQASVCVEHKTPAIFPLNNTFTAWRFFPARRSVGTFSSTLDGYWANGSDKGQASGAITLSQDEHLGKSAMRCVFSPLPQVSWSNVNSPSFEIGDADSVELAYAGDGSAHTVHAVLYALQSHNRPSFYRFSLSLAVKEWTNTRIALSEFRNDRGDRFDPASVTGAVSFQLAPGKTDNTPVTLWLQSVALLNGSPVKEAWRNDAAFDESDVDNLRAGHRPQPPPPAVAARQPLVRFTEPSKPLLANWDGKGSEDAKPMVVIEHIALPNAAPFLRVTLPAGECAWGNANIPLSADALRGQDGLAFRLRALPASETVALALHAAPQNGGQRFYHADGEASETGADTVLPWSEFRRDDGQAFTPASCAWVNLQISRPSGPLTRDLVIEIEHIDTFTKAREHAAQPR